MFNITTFIDSTDSVFIGALGTSGTNGFAGYIHEIIICDTFLSDEEILPVEAYLMSKWGV